LTCPREKKKSGVLERGVGDTNSSWKRGKLIGCKERDVLRTSKNATGEARRRTMWEKRLTKRKRKNLESRWGAASEGGEEMSGEKQGLGARWGGANRKNAGKPLQGATAQEIGGQEKKGTPGGRIAALRGIMASYGYEKKTGESGGHELQTETTRAGEKVLSRKLESG